MWPGLVQLKRSEVARQMSPLVFVSAEWKCDKSPSLDPEFPLIVLVQQQNSLL